MPKFKTTFLFNQSRFGWTEVWYREASELKAMEVPSAVLAAARSVLLGRGSRIEAIRMTSVDKPYKRKLQKFKAAESTWGGETDQAPAAILARLYDKDVIYSRLVTLRGCADNDIKIDANGNPAAFSGFTEGVFQDFVQALKAGGWTWKARGKTGVGGMLIQITDIVIKGSGRLAFAIPGFAGAVGSFFDVTGSKGNGEEVANGKHQVHAVVGNEVETRTVPPPGTTFADIELGFARAITVDWPIPDSGELLRPGKRDTGRAFFVSRGRRPASK